MRRDLRGRSRMILVWGLAVFLALNVGLSLGILMAWPELRDPIYHQKAGPLKARTVAVEPRPLTLLALGTSRMEAGLQARILEDATKVELGQPLVAYNFAAGGAGPMMRLIFLRRLLAEGVRPDLVLLEVFPPTLTRHSETYEFGRIPGTRLSMEELDIIRRFQGPIEEAQTSWSMSWLVPWYQHRLTLRTWLTPSAISKQGPGDLRSAADSWGHRRNPDLIMTPAQQREALAKARQQYKVRVLGKRFELSDKLTAAYREILAVCREEGITAILVCMPEGPAFQSWYPTGAWEQVEEFLLGLNQEFGVAVVNCRDWCAKRIFRIRIICCCLERASSPGGLAVRW